ncbi:MAG TPA: TIGR02285 family protein [Burkholderiaceae bacterium]|jgi:uncharacterized protein (TIGR02285 family)
MFASVQAHAEESRVESITWLLGEAPGHTTGLSDGVNPADWLLPYLREHWPGVKQVVLLANARRTWQMLANGEQACSASSVRTPEREKIAYFTNTLLGPPLQLIVRREKLSALPRNAAGEIELARVLADEHLTGALIEGRSYGSYIDKLLARRPENKSVTLYAASDFGSKILPMLDIGRADYSIGYDVAIAEARARNPGSQLFSQPIAGASAPVAAGVACPRTLWGLAAIHGIDRALGTPAGAAMLREITEHWMTPESRQHYGARLDAFYKERAKPSVIR